MKEGFCQALWVFGLFAVLPRLVARPQALPEYLLSPIRGPLRRFRSFLLATRLPRRKIGSVDWQSGPLARKIEAPGVTSGQLVTVGIGSQNRR